MVKNPSVEHFEGIGLSPELRLKTVPTPGSIQTCKVHKIIPSIAAPAILSIDLAKTSTHRGDSSHINASSSTLKKERDVKTAKFLTTSDS
jgi:hypothetical protein